MSIIQKPYCRYTIFAVFQKGTKDMNTPKMKKYAAGEIILHEGEYSTFFYKILVGNAALYKNMIVFQLSTSS
jgi:CRP-like cAMP-binding protein